MSESESELRVIKVEVEGHGEFELREPLFDDVEPLFGKSGKDSAHSFGLDLLKKCVYKDGVLVWSKPVSASLGIKLMNLAPRVMELVGFDESGKDSTKDS